MKQLCNSYHQLNEPEPQDRETSTMCSGGHVVAQTPADTWSLEPEDDVDVEECRLRPAGPRSMLGWKPTCLRACLVRWSLRMKHLSQSGHMKRFSPVCVRKCRVSSSDRENFFAQSGHVQWKGLSPKNGERNLTLLLFQDFQPQLRKTASGKKKTVDTFRFVPMHASTFTGVLATCSVRVCDVKTEKTQIFDGPSCQWIWNALTGRDGTALDFSAAPRAQCLQLWNQEVCASRHRCVVRLYAVILVRVALKNADHQGPAATMHLY